jgi:protein-disulfide isomerase/uncharacterized membrane protein
VKRTNLFVAGLLALLVSTVSSLILVMGHIGALSVPGCSENSPCAQAAASVWGKVPGIGWPTSFLGLAYFISALVVWCMVRGGPSLSLRYLARLGVLISVGFVAVILLDGYNCPYCLVAHAANLAFWMVVERSPLQRERPWRPVVSLAVVFVCASAVMAATEWRKQSEVTQQQEEELIASTAEILAGAGDQPQWDYPWEGAFCGRYVYGPRRAPIRIVIFTDYQCPDCARIDEEVRDLIDTRRDISLSVKHYPMNSDCNANARNRMHPNACRAARAAETAGLLAGEEGFWKMHFWLFEHGGSFSTAELNAALGGMNLDPLEFAQMMTSEAPLRRVQTDIEEGAWLGLYYTPMVFINGIELKGIFTPNAVTRAVAQLTPHNLPSLGHDVDRPPPAAEKYVADWRHNTRLNLPADEFPWRRGPDSANVRIVVWGDYQEQNTAKALGEIEEQIADRDDTSFSFRHYPLNQDCNPGTPVHKFHWACKMSKAAEAAGQVAGLDGYWRMHAWLLENQGHFSEKRLRAGIIELGFDADQILQAMESEAVATAVRKDCEAGDVVRLRGVPMVVINERHVSRWQRKGVPVLEQIIMAAAAE